MINNDRIVPVTRIDLISLYATALNAAAAAASGTAPTVLASEDVEGTFKVAATASASIFLANQPVKTLELGKDCTVYFVPAFDYEGVIVGDDKTKGTVTADGASLYKAVLSSTTLTITAVTPQV